MGVLRAKFKKRAELFRDTLKFRDRLLNKNLDELPDKVVLSVLADSQIGEGVIDLELYALDDDNNKYDFRDNKLDFLEFETREDYLLDIMSINLEDKSLIREFFEKGKSLNVYIMATCEGILRGFSVSNLSVFENLRCIVTMHYGDKRQIVFERVFDEFDAEHSSIMSYLCKIEFNNDGTLKLKNMGRKRDDKE